MRTCSFELWPSTTTVEISEIAEWFVVTHRDVHTTNRGAHLSDTQSVGELRDRALTEKLGGLLVGGVRVCAAMASDDEDERSRANSDLSLIIDDILATPLIAPKAVISSTAVAYGAVLRVVEKISGIDAVEVAQDVLVQLMRDDDSASE